MTFPTASEAPPAANGDTMRTERLGQSCASDGAVRKISAAVVAVDCTNPTQHGGAPPVQGNVADVIFARLQYGGILGRHHRLRLVRVWNGAAAHCRFRSARPDHGAVIELDVHRLVLGRGRVDCAQPTLPPPIPITWTIPGLVYLGTLAGKYTIAEMIGANLIAGVLIIALASWASARASWPGCRCPS